MILSVPRIIEKCVSLKDLWMIHWKIWHCKGCKIPVHQIFIALYEAFVGLPCVWTIGQLSYVNAISKTILISLFCLVLLLFFFLIFFFLSAPFIYWIQLRFRSVPVLDRLFCFNKQFCWSGSSSQTFPLPLFLVLSLSKSNSWHERPINHSYSLRCIKYVHSKPLEQH